MLDFEWSRDWPWVVLYAAFCASPFVLLLLAIVMYT